MLRGARSLGAIGLLVGSLACDRPGDAAATGAASASARGATTAAASARAVTRATITMDDAHDLMKNGAGYVIAPATELVIEIGSHHLRDAGGPADAVHVAHRSSEYYRASWAGGARITLNAASLDPVKGGAFSGFEAGEEYLVAIGSEAPSPDGVLRFAPAWTTKITVAPR